MYEIVKREEMSATWLRTGVKPELRFHHQNYNVLKRHSDTMTENGDALFRNWGGFVDGI